MTRGKGSKKRNSKNHADVIHVLEKVSQKSLGEWRQASEEIDFYEYSLFYSLDTLRATHEEQINQSFQDVPGVALDLNSWGRIVDYTYTLQPLSAKGSLVRSGRLNYGNDIDPTRFPTFASLYIAEDGETAYREKFGLRSKDKVRGLTPDELALRDKNSYSVVKLTGQINNVFDLTKPSNLKPFCEATKHFKIPDFVNAAAKKLMIKPPRVISDHRELQKSIMSQDWRRQSMLFDIPSNSQVFGRLLFDAGYEGVLYPSSKGRGKCLAIYPFNMRNGESYVSLLQPYPDSVSISRLDASTWNQAVE